MGGIAPKSIDANTLRLSATRPTQACPTSGGAPNQDLNRRYNNVLGEFNGDGIKDLKVHFSSWARVAS